MRTSKLALAALALGSVSLSGCAYGIYGDPYGYGPYGGVSYGYDYGYGSPYYGYGQPYYGWYDGYYYPGTGYYVYDRHHNRHRWTDAQRRYWEWRRQGSPAAEGRVGRTLEDWAASQNGAQSVTTTTDGVRTRVIERSSNVFDRGATSVRHRRFEDQPGVTRIERKSSRRDRDDD